jgi:hypothetical protein
MAGREDGVATNSVGHIPSVWEGKMGHCFLRYSYTSIMEHSASKVK